MGRRIEILIIFFTGILIASVLVIGSILLTNLKAIEKQSRLIHETNKTIPNIPGSQHNPLKKVVEENIKATDRNHELARVFFGSTLIFLALLAILFVYYFKVGRRYRKHLNKAMGEAKAYAKARENFLANMSHEMRTPLNAITGFSEQLLASPLNDEQKQHVNIVSSAAKHLLNLVNDILDLSKIESGKIIFEKIVFSPREQIEGAVQFLNQKIVEKGLTVELSFDKDLPSSLVGDPLRLKQVLLNLLDNSIKFTNKGGVKVHVGARNQNAKMEGKTDLWIVVEDTGIGIAGNMIDKIFRNFTQADSSITRKYGGTGLGLSITKKIIELQQGEIKLESQLNKGTRVTFRIPYELSSSTQNAKQTEEKYTPTIIPGKKVLIADDELFNRILLATILKRWNVELDEAGNGNQALDMVRENNYDVVLMDVRMPEISGIDATKMIRKFKDKKKANVPIIALTAAAFEEKRRKCMEAGMNGMITKPFKEAELLKLMETVLIKSQKNEKV